MAKAPRTPAYRFTIDSLDDPKLEVLREEVRNYNKNSTDVQYHDRYYQWLSPTTPWTEVCYTSKLKRRIKIHGRLGKDNPNAEIVRKKFYREVPLDLAKHFDVYVHPTRASWKKNIDYVEEVQKVHVSALYNRIRNDVLAQVDRAVLDSAEYSSVPTNVRKMLLAFAIEKLSFELANT